MPGRELSGPGGWEDAFGRVAELVVEIGFGRDPFLLDRATAHPEQDHVGIERDPSRAEDFAEKVERRGLTNVRVLPVSAELALAYCFEPGSLAELHVYFPDPWPKLRHQRNRLVQPWFAREAHRLLAPDGTLFLATDDAPYREQMHGVLEDDGLFRNEIGPHAASQQPVSGHATKFERLWRRRGRGIHHLVLRPVGAA